MWQLSTRQWWAVALSTVILVLVTVVTIVVVVLVRRDSAEDEEGAEDGTQNTAREEDKTETTDANDPEINRSTEENETTDASDPEITPPMSGDPGWRIMTTDKFRCVSKILFPNPEYTNQDIVTCYPITEDTSENDAQGGEPTCYQVGSWTSDPPSGKCESSQYERLLPSVSGCQRCVDSSLCQAPLELDGGRCVDKRERAEVACDSAGTCAYADASERLVACQESCIKTQLEGDNPSFCGGGGSWYGTCKFAEPDLVNTISRDEAKAKQ